MKIRSKKIEIKSLIVSATIALVSILAAVLIPDDTWRPPPVSSRIGPSRYSSEVSNQAVTIADVSGIASQPTTLTLKFQYRVSSRPTDYAYLIATSSNPDGGVRVSIDNWGNINLSVESENKTASPYQLIKISDPHELDVWLELSVFIDTSLEQIKIVIDDRIVQIGEARDSHVIQISDMMLTTSAIQIGGANDHNFNGDIQNFEMSFGSSGIQINLINLKIFFGLVALICLGLVFQFSMKRKLIVT